MKDITPYIKKSVDDVKMTDAERAFLWSRIEEYKAMKPMRHTPPASSSALKLSFFMLLARPLAAALVLVVVFTGGVSYAAESALPGSPLYTVKTRVNEPLRLALASDPQAKAEVQITLAERRIAEATELAAEGKLDAGIQEKLAAAFEEHARGATAIVSEVESQDSSAAVEISSRFESRLAAHESVLERIQPEREGRESRLSRSIRSVGLAVSEIRTRTEQKVAVSAPHAVADTAPIAISIASESISAFAAPAPESEAAASRSASHTAEPSAYDTKTAKHMHTSAEKNLKDTQKKLRSARTLDGETRAGVEAELAEAELLINEGREYLGNNSPALAFHAFQQSLIISEKLDVMLGASVALNKAKVRNDKNDKSGRSPDTARAKEPEVRDVARGKAPGGESAATLALPNPAENPEAATLSITSDQGPMPESAGNGSLDSALAPDPMLPPPTQIFVPHRDVLEGIIQGASTSVESDVVNAAIDLDKGVLPVPALSR